MPKKNQKRIDQLVAENSHDELVEKAKELDLPHSGSKEDIATRISAKESEEGGGGEETGGAAGDQPSQEDIDKKREGIAPGEGNFGTQTQPEIMERTEAEPKKEEKKPDED